MDTKRKNVRRTGTPTDTGLEVVGTFRLSADSYDRLKAWAALENRSISQQIRHVVEHALPEESEAA